MIRRCTCVFLVSVAAFQIACLQSGNVHGRQIDARSTLRIESGNISGVSLGADRDVTGYLGIPYAAPPTGNLRWKPPQPVEPWRVIRLCSDFGPSCPQADLSQVSYRPLAGNVSEDCLYLNVWTPKERTHGQLPVMVWIHGGGFITGSGSADDSNGEALARKGIVSVTFNYRLGPFGFLAHPLLSKESENNVSGNYGLLDQIAALQWVKKNIKAFGGDPERVTIFGASAGAVSVCYLMTSPLAKGLFQRAISQSGIFSNPTLPLRSPTPGQLSMEKQGELVAHDLGCDTQPNALAALRARSTEDILAISDPSRRLFAGIGNRFAPVVDGWALPGDLLTLFREGKQWRVPLIIGTNADEGSLSFLFRPQPTSIEQYKEEVRNWFPDDAREVLEAYAIGQAAEIGRALSRIQTDFAFVAPARLIARSMSKAGDDANAFLYNFTRVRATRDGELFGAFHGAEIPFVFCNLKGGVTRGEETDRSLSSVISNYWIRFAAAGNPNESGLPEWPSYKDAARCHLELGDAIQVKADLRGKVCDLFDKAGLHQRQHSASFSATNVAIPPPLAVRRAYGDPVEGDYTAQAPGSVKSHRGK